MVRVVAHCANPFLPATTVWIYDQIRMLKRYRPVVLTQVIQNADIFPCDSIYSAEHLSTFKQGVYRAVRKLRGTHLGYGKWLREAGASLIHAHFGQEGFRCLGARRETGLPLVTTFYGLDVSALPRKALWRKRFARLFDEGDLFLAEGPCMAEKLVSIGCSQDRVVVQHLGVDLSQLLFVPFSERDFAAPTVLTYAVFREKKGLIYALRAFAKIAVDHPNARLQMIGDGPLRPELEREIQHLGLAERVSLLGYLGHEEALKELAKAHVLLYPSVTASDGDTEGGAPVALIESMALGTPVVSTRHADIPEVVPEGVCGILVKERDVDGLADGVSALLRDEALRAEMGQAGRTRVARQHDLGNQIEKLEQIYDGLVGI